MPISNADVRPDVDTGSQRASELPFSLPLELMVHDPETIAELCAHAEGEARNQYAVCALRVGVLALKQARGQIDADLVRRESERLLKDLNGRLCEHSRLVQDRLTASLKEYFDPEDGRFHERVERLVREDGELEQTLRRQIGREDSELHKTLTAHLGESSPLMKMLSPDQSKGLLSALKELLDERLEAQRKHVLGEFSLDNKKGALSRFINELGDRQGKLSDDLHGKLDEVVKQFSLDEEDSALSRLVRNVERAQAKITSEFSLDEEASALSRLKKLLEGTNEAIHSHLSLDDESSALARLKRELLTLMKDHREDNQKFQEEVKSALGAMVARKEEAARSTRHGLAFEEAVFEMIRHESQNAGDVASHTGQTTGRIRNCKKGDCVVELGPDSAAPGARFVIEAKEVKAYTLSNAREEIEEARKNRDAGVGLFVYSQQSAPESLEPLMRLGQDVFVVWNAEDARSDVFLKAGVSLARALCVRGYAVSQSHASDVAEIEKAILELEKGSTALDKIETWAQTINNRSSEILKSAVAMRNLLKAQIEVLNDKTLALKQALDAATS